MSHPIPDTPRCVAYCSRIDLAPCRVAAALWITWLLLVGAVVLSAAELPWVVRLVLCPAVLLAGIRCVRSFVLLSGPEAIRVIEWSEQGEFRVRLGPDFRPEPASLAPGSFRLGVECWVLRFMTPAGLRPVLITGGDQDTDSFRRLSRCLTMHLRRASGRGEGAAVTIRPKV